MTSSTLSVLPALAPGAKYVGYYRVSRDDQNEAMQVDALIALGVLRENIYGDHASGRTLKRTGVQTVFKALRPGDVLVVWHQDRLTRSIANLESIVADFRDRGIALFSLMSRVDITTPGGLLVARIAAAVGEYDLDMISLRTKAGQAAGRERGFHPGAPSKLTDPQWEKLFADIAKRPEKHSVKAWRKIIGKKYGVHEATIRGRLMKRRRFATKRRRAKHDEANA